ncbi:AraC family transcriptional regulator [Actinoplanes sp. NPDC051494]|uniref:AraC family transcriptional regulator n=1 Tax=Actinoplanes sp. NPDC051494 TaxID=3363907 RepID=UPI0037AAD59B
MDLHSHSEGQLVYAAAGALATTTEQGTWVAPANRVTWTPPGFQHAHRFYGETDVRLDAIPVDLCGDLVAQPSVFTVSAVLRAVLLALTDRPETRPGAYDRLRAVALDELGMSFHRWRTILRIHHGLIHLTNGRSVTGTAIACGWSNPTSFIEAFAEIVGQTPGRYQAELRSGIR